VPDSLKFIPREALERAHSKASACTNNCNELPTNLVCRRRGRKDGGDERKRTGDESKVEYQHPALVQLEEFARRAFRDGVSRARPDAPRGIGSADRIRFANAETRRVPSRATKQSRPKWPESSIGIVTDAFDSSIGNESRAPQ